MNPILSGVSPGNSADPLTGYGGVAYPYSIGTHEVTPGEYVDFLNSSDPGDSNSLELFNTSMQTSIH